MSLVASKRAGVPVPSEASGFPGDYLRGRAEGFLPRHPSREEDWRARIEEVHARPAAPAVWERAARTGERLGADSRSTANARSLGRGGVLCVTTGQQPGLLLGPLYTVYKAMTAVALARWVEGFAGRPTVPVFWSAADDSDLAEIGTAFLPGEGFRLTRHTLDGTGLPAGGMVGDLDPAGTRRVLEEARSSGGAGITGSPILRRLDRALARAGDHGELAIALLHDLFRDTGLVVVDGRWPELRRAAGPLFRRWTDHREEVARAVLEVGRVLERQGYRPRIREASTRAALFDVRTGRRRPFEGDDAQLRERIERSPETLSPNVLLRPLVQDSLFPNVATIGGPGEIAYHAQLAPEYEMLGVPMPILFPRFEATLVPPGVRELARRRGAGLEAFVRDFDGAMRATADRVLPEGLRSALEELEHGQEAAWERARREAERFDGKLARDVPRAARRVRESARRLRERAAAAARAAETARDPAVKFYREFLRPRGVPQERVLSALALFLESENHPLECLAGPLESHLTRAREGRPVHWLLDFGAGRERDGS